VNAKIETKKEGWAARRAWLVILLFALGFSAWSLFTMARSMGAPAWLAVGASAVFDGAAIVVGDQAHRTRLEGDSALAERLFTAVLVGCSAWLNWQHAAHVGWGSFGLLPAAAPVVAEVLFEFKMKFSHRAHLRAQGLVAPRMVPLGRWSWLVFPGRSWHVVKAQISGRLDAIETAAGTGELLMSGGWLQVEAKAEQIHGRPQAADDGGAELPAAPRPALTQATATAPVDLSGVFRLTPVVESVTAPMVSQEPSGTATLTGESVTDQATEIEQTFSDRTMSGLSHEQVNPEVGDSLAQGLNGHKRVSAAHSKPARRANQVTARVAGGADWEEAARIWRETPAPNGGRISSRKLALLTGLSQTTCHRIITEAKAAEAAEVSA
jgi:hypothetical protein